MSAHSQGSGTRSNAYSASKFTNWTKYDPFWMEAKAALKRYDRELPVSPQSPKVIFLRPLEGFRHACSVDAVEYTLGKMRPEFLTGLRAVFLLSGTRKQEQAWRRGRVCYGLYWWNCVFLCAWKSPSEARIEHLRDYYLDTVLPHEIAHHHDRSHRNSRQKNREAYAEAFVQQRAVLK